MSRSRTGSCRSADSAASCTRTACLIGPDELVFETFGPMMLICVRAEVMPILKEVGVEGAPEIYQAHAFVSA